MRALMFDGQLRLKTGLPAPELQDDQALLKIRRAGICNTDLELIAGYKDFRGILGHEFVGEVVSGASEWVGKRVVGEINVNPPQCACDFCQQGIPTQCRNRTTVGIDRHPGAFADLLALTVRNLHSVPDTVTDDQAVFVEPLAAALQMLEAVHVTPHSRVIVLGAGKLGMLCAQVLRLTGAEVWAVVRREKQAALLQNWGIIPIRFEEIPSRDAELVVDCTGTAAGFADALSLIRPRGTILLKSTYHGLPQADLTRIVVDEIRVIGSRCGPFDAALRLLSNGQVDVDSLIETCYPFSDALTAFEHASRKGAFKVLLSFE